MKLPFKPIQLDDADIFSVEKIHNEYWQDFFDACHTRIGYDKELKNENYETRYEDYKIIRQLQLFHEVLGCKWEIVMPLRVNEQTIERFRKAYELFCSLKSDDNVFLPMLQVLLKMQQSIEKHLKEDGEMLEYLYPRETCISFNNLDDHQIMYETNYTDDIHLIEDISQSDSQILKTLKKERIWDKEWQYYLKHAGDVKTESEGLQTLQSIGSLCSDLMRCVVGSFNQSLTDFSEQFYKVVTMKMCNYEKIIIYRLFQTFLVSGVDSLKVLFENPDHLILRNLIDTRSSLINEFKSSKLGYKWCECIMLDNGMELIGRYLINHREEISDEEEKRFFYLLDEICILTDIICGRTDKYLPTAKIEYATEKEDVITANEITSTTDNNCAIANIDQDNYTILNLIFKKNHNGKRIDIERLREIIDNVFVNNIKYGYEWLALWRILNDLQLIEEMSFSQFEKQMNNWFPKAKKTCIADSMGDYSHPYLGSTKFVKWDEGEFLKNKTSKQSLSGYRKLYNDCYTLKEALNHIPCIE